MSGWFRVTVVYIGGGDEVSPKVAKARPVMVSNLAATVLGKTRDSGDSVTARGLATMFPAFNAQELENALGELIDKHLLIQKGTATYVLTEIGRAGRVGVA